jgi:hypothetical protein
LNEIVAEFTAKFGTFFATEVFMGGIIRSTFTRTASKKESESAAKTGFSADVKVKKK